MKVIDVNIETLSDEVQMPHYATEGSSGADVRAHLSENLVISPGKSVFNTYRIENRDP